MIEFVGEGAGISTADMHRKIREIIRKEHVKLSARFGETAVARVDPYELQVRVGGAVPAVARVYMTTVGPASNGERAGALYMEVSVGGKVVGRYGGFGKTDGPYEKGVESLGAGSLSESKDSRMDTSRIDWLGVGREVHGGDHRGVEAAIAAMEWVDYVKGMSLPFSQGHAIRELMKEFRINRITALSYDGAVYHTPGKGSEDGNWHIMGIQIPYKDGPRRLYFADGGTHLVPLCTIPVID